MSHTPVQARDAYLMAPTFTPRGDRSPAGSSASHAQHPPRRLLSAELLDGEREIEIEHAGAVYRLRRTSLGKLILTK